jgi:predicted RecA/RadA family phage recombinase
MAKNRRRINGRFLELNVSALNGSGTSDLVLSGDPGVIGGLAFVALTDEDDDGNASVDTGGVYELSVLADSGAGGSAVAPGDVLYWDNTAGDLSKDAAKLRFGVALGSVASTETGAIEVRVGY